MDQVVENLTTITAAAHGIHPPSTRKTKKQDTSFKKSKIASADSSNGSANGGAVSVVMKCEGEGAVGHGDSGAANTALDANVVSGSGGDVMEVEGSHIPAASVFESTECKEEEPAMEVSENGAISNATNNDDKHHDQVCIKANHEDNGGSGDDNEEEEELELKEEGEGVMDSQDVLDAQAQLDRIHLCLVNRLTADLHITLDLDAKDALPAVRLPLNQLTWPEIARMVTLPPYPQTPPSSPSPPLSPPIPIINLVMTIEFHFPVT